MTDDGILEIPLPDARARARIASDLETNLLVEAGAGSGKTRELVSRMTALIASGTAEIDRLAAVTFTRKAAAELRERFQMRLEEALREERAGPSGDGLLVDRLERALEGIDRAFVGTIHSFCARLLRERPLEIGLDPGFEELPVEERVRVRDRFWEAYLERLARDSDPILEELSASGIRPALLAGAFERLVENPDVEFPAEDTEPPSAPELGPIRAELEAIVDEAWELIPERQPPRDWDSLQKKLRTLHFIRDVTGWKDSADLFGALAVLCKRGSKGHKITQNRWKNADFAKALRDRVNAFTDADTPAQRVVERWYAHRYSLAIRLARHAAGEFAAHRLRAGRLDFQDLLVLTARLLRENPAVRRQLGERYRHLLVDEFQDTDPLQAEIVLLLASEPTGGADGDASRSGQEGAPESTRSRGEAPAGVGTERPRADTEAPDASAGDPAEAGPVDGSPEMPEWRRVRPRPGALFVVGDPKQSIYRFRRADIQLYGLVKERFADFGAVVELTANFRSRAPIGDLVNELFRGPGFFPEEETEEQAAFEPLQTRPPERPVAREGVFVYDIEPDASNQAAAARDDAARISAWIRGRVDTGERDAGDFLVLTRRKGQLSAYARAMEAHGLPVQVTGAGVGAEEEIRELEVVLECMIDPANPVKVVAALVGLFFGIDYEQLLAHRLDEGSFDVMRPRDRGDPEVLAALRSLHSWWNAAVSEPADVFIGRLVTELGLLPYAAAGDLGTLRAGALVYALDAVRAAALAGDASLPGALSALRSALALSEAEAPLEPGRTDVVRLMNLHQAKGLEGTVVVLADPSGSRDRAPEAHTVRRADGTAVGFLRVAEARSGYGGDRVLALPVGWDEKADTELRFAAAEEVRLTYVAVTRAREELVVARWPGGRGTSAWASLEPWLEERAEVLRLEPSEPRRRERLEMTAESAARAVREARQRLGEMGERSFTHASVTEIAKSPVAASDSVRPRAGRRAADGFRGLTWGSAVHGALAAAAQRGVTDEGIRAACRDLLVEHERPLDDHGEPVELLELLDLVRTVRSSELWRRAHAAEQCLVEVPFASPGTASPAPPARTGRHAEPSGGRRQLDLFAASREDGEEHDAHPPRAEGETGLHVLEGVIDLAFREPDGWVVADYKTDVGTDPDFPVRAEAYRRQVDLYAEAWARLTGEPVKERVLFYTTRGHVDRWS